METAVVKLHTYILTASAPSAREAAQTQTSTHMNFTQQKTVYSQIE